MKSRMVFGEAIRSMGANLSTTVAATMTVLIGMFLLGLFIALGTWVWSWTEDVKEGVLVKVFFDRDASERQINAVGNRVASMPEVKEIVFVSKEEALVRMKERYPDLTQDLASNPLPPAFEITAKKAEQVEVIAGRLDPPPSGVDEVTFAQDKTERILEVAWIVGSIFIAGSVILLVASTVLIANTIRLSIFARRREIEVMKLVGATNWFVRGPFMLEGLLTGLAGSLIAILLLFLAKRFALPVIEGRENALTDPDVHAMSFLFIALILVGMSLLVGAAGSVVTVRRFLRV